MASGKSRKGGASQNQANRPSAVKFGLQGADFPVGMKIVRTYESAGELWGETADGAKVKWDAGGERWGEPIAPERGPIAPEPEPGLSVQFSLGRSPEGIVGSNGNPHPDSFDLSALTPIDEAWNKKFPPFSLERLLFGLAVLPFMGLLVGLYRRWVYGEKFSWGIYLFTVVAGAILLTGVFAFQWWKEGEIIRGKRRRGGDGGETIAGKIWQMPAGQEIAVTTVLFFVGMAGSWAIVESSVLSPLFLLALLAASGLIAVLLRYRLWMLMAVLLSLGVGFVAAIFLTLFATFMGGSDNLVVNWLITSALVFSFAAPIAWMAKKKAEELERRWKIPTWFIAGMTCVLMLVGAVFFAVFEDENDVEATLASQPIYMKSTLMSPRIATQQLYLAWQAVSRAEAEKVASPEVIDQLFAEPYRGQAYRGCGYLQGKPAEYRCVIQSSDHLILLTALHTDGGFYIGKIVRAPLDTAIVGVTVAAPLLRRSQPHNSKLIG